MVAEYVSQLVECEQRYWPEIPWRKESVTLLGANEVYSINHPDFKPGRPFHGDIGGPFTLLRGSVRANTVSVNTPYHRGELFPSWINSAPFISRTAVLPTGVDVEELIVYGTESIARCSPTNPSVNLATFLGELLLDKGIGKIPGDDFVNRRNKIQAAGSEYLNVEFGWKPFVSDVLAIAHAVKNRNAIIEQYVKNSDKHIRRRTALLPSEPDEKEDSSDTQVVHGTAYTVAHNDRDSGPGTYTASYKKKVWFSGAFRYHIPLGNDLASRLRRSESIANHLLGIRLTPEVLWNVMPWSWLTDYWYDTSSIMTNISQLGHDGLVLQYGYVMCHVRAEQRNEAVGGTMAGSSLIHISESKQRIGANPYGFGKRHADLTPRQQAVIVALGLSKGGRPYGQNP